MKCKCSEGIGTKTKVLPAYEATGLGAPFKVILENAVKVEVCAKCDKTLGTFIPDMKGLFHAVVFSRALEPRKLNGQEIRFMRKAMGWKSKDLAKELGVSAEHFSRYENGKTMPIGPEKLFRLYALLKTPDQSALRELDPSKIFDMIEIQSIWDPTKPLEFHFFRRKAPAEPVDGDEGKWRKDLKAA